LTLLGGRSKDDASPPEISFAISIDTSGTSAQTTVEAVSQAQEQAVHMVTMPTSLGEINAAIDMANAAGTLVLQATDVLSPLLSKIAKFNDIVLEIADVC
jgi:hypothetical protein